MSKSQKPAAVSAIVTLAVLLLPGSALAQAGGHAHDTHAAHEGHSHGTHAPAQTSAQATKLVVQDAWVRKPPGDSAAVYFVLKNDGAKSLSVVGASSPVARHVMIHETTTVDGHSRMRMRESVDIPAGQSVKFAPEGLHVMLNGFTKELDVGDTLPLTLTLADGAQVRVAAVVRPLDAK